ncbi:MAG TPA: AMP-binding protein [Beijerinckiaceae bacterium]
MSRGNTALATADDGPEPWDALSWSGMSLGGLMAAVADRHPDRPAFRDQPDREQWSGRPRIDWTYRFAGDVAGRLARHLVGLNLPPRSLIGICLPNGSEACLALLAVEEAGHLPCLLPIAWSEADLAEAVEGVGVQAVITQGIVGEERPAEIFCHVAARYFGLRFIMSFGPLVPDGVVDLDRVILDSADGETLPVAAGESGVVTFARRDERWRPIYRGCASIVAAAVAYLVQVKVDPGERILSLLAPDDHRGLTTGLVASLVSGATLECHGLFEAAAFSSALEQSQPTHLVVPGWMEPAFGKAGLDRLRSLALVHAAPARFKARPALRGPVIDVLAFGETALLARARDEDGHFALTLDEDPRRGGTARGLLQVRREADGQILFAGPAADARAFDRGGPAPPGDGWVASGFRADMFAGIVIGVS